MLSNIVRHIIALLIGTIVTLLVVIFDAIVIEGLLSWSLIPFVFPPAYGSIIAGYIAQKRGWLIGLLIAGIYEVSYILFLAQIIRSERNAINVVRSEWLLFLGTIVLCAAGGYLGTFFATLAKRKRFEQSRSRHNSSRCTRDE